MTLFICLGQRRKLPLMTKDKICKVLQHKGLISISIQFINVNETAQSQSIKTSLELSVSSPVPYQQPPTRSALQNSFKTYKETTSRYTDCNVDIHHLFVKTTNLGTNIDRNCKNLVKQTLVIYLKITKLSPK